MRTRLIGLAPSFLMVCSAMAEPVLITSSTTVARDDTHITPTAGGNPVALADAEITVSGAALTMDGKHLISSLSLVSSAVLNHSSHTASAPPTGLDLEIIGDLIVEAGSTINVATRGYAPLAGPGAGGNGGTFNAIGGSGGGYGGVGGSSPLRSGGRSYGDLYAPASIGSGGGHSGNSSSGGGRGGGRFAAIVGGQCVIDGAINANGQDASTCCNGAGGSGGAIYLRIAGNLAGAGAFHANGGIGRRGCCNSKAAGGGGGGRIAVYAGSTSFVGTLQAIGGDGSANAQDGGAGTICTRYAAGPLEVLIDNDVRSGARTELVGFNVVQGNMTIRNGAKLGHASRDLTAMLEVHGDLVLESSGQINVDSQGYRYPSGPGAGSPGNDCCYHSSGGGGHGGSGGDGGHNNAHNGERNGSQVDPGDFGSPGGRSNGGFGGGRIIAAIDGDLMLDGSILARGQGKEGTSRGGAGGTVNLRIGGSLTGQGFISVKGGNGGFPGGTSGNSGGGGGAGRVALRYTSSLFSGQIEATGGSGPQMADPGFPSIPFEGVEVMPLPIMVDRRDIAIPSDSSFLKTCSALSVDSEPIPLQAFGADPGTKLWIEPRGSYAPIPGGAETASAGIAIFSCTLDPEEVLDPYEENVRVDCPEAPEGVTTLAPFISELPCLIDNIIDEPNAFIVPAGGLSVTVPGEARYLYFAPFDGSSFVPYTDADGDYGVRLHSVRRYDLDQNSQWDFFDVAQLQNFIESGSLTGDMTLDGASDASDILDMIGLDQ